MLAFALVCPLLRVAISFSRFAFISVHLFCIIRYISVFSHSASLLRHNILYFPLCFHSSRSCLPTFALIPRFVRVYIVFCPYQPYLFVRFYSSRSHMLAFVIV